MLLQGSPLVHNITNYVAMNFTANVLLAVGASPVMAHAPEEVEELAALAGALVINIGTLSATWVESMVCAGRAAKKSGTPVVFDPVGVGATRYRGDAAARILAEVRPDVIRGNGSEIMALAGEVTRGRGVDSLHGSAQAVMAARSLAERSGAIVCVSGEIDYVVSGVGVCSVESGHPMMTRVTAMGCAATAMIGAFVAAQGVSVESVAQAMSAMGVAGEIAATRSTGPGGFQSEFLDALYGLTSESLASRARIKWT